MTDDKVITFWLNVGILGHFFKLWYARARKIYNERFRRHLDRYYRVGRHKAITVGLANIRWASTLTVQLRVEHQFQHHG